MSYVGSAPSPSQVQFSTLDAQAFNGDGSTTAFTLNRAVSIAASIEVTVNNVQQSPYDGSYTVNGTTTLTFSEAPSSGTDNIYVRFLDYPLASITPGAGTVGLTQLSATGTPSSSTFLRGDNSWQSVPSPTPGGSNTYVQYNNSGSFGGSANFVFDGTNVTIGSSSNSYGGVLGIFSSGNTRFDVATTSATGQQIVSFGQNGTAKWQVISDLAASGSGDLDFVVPGVGSKFKFNSSGAIGLSGSNYGTSGQVLTSAGSGAAPSWQTPGVAVPSAYSSVGSYIIATEGAGNYNYGSTISGSSLQSVALGYDDGSTPSFIIQAQGSLGISGTWRAQAYASKDAGNQRYGFGLWVRIS